MLVILGPFFKEGDKNDVSIKIEVAFQHVFSPSRIDFFKNVSNIKSGINLPTYSRACQYLCVLSFNSNAGLVVMQWDPLTVKDCVVSA